MEYFSTRNRSERRSAPQAIAEGLAPDGGLYVPERIPKIDAAALGELCALDYRARAKRIMAPFLEEFSGEELEALIDAAYGERFDTPAVAPLRRLNGDTAFLELWHGPTCAFKDMALQVLPRLLTASLKKTGETRQVCILVATSGDTGKAALEGFKDVPGTRIFVFYPDGGVSPAQRLQMVTQEGDNVAVSAVRGNFDDAQSGVKRIFSDRAFAGKLSERGWFLSSANSINWGRLLPQIVYYFSAYCDLVNAGGVPLGAPVNFCVPTGNFGNILAGWFAREMGLPAARFVCASNANNVLTDFIRSGVYDRNRPFHTTISPSMDILVSSNLERLLYQMEGDRAAAAYMERLNREGRYSVEPETLSRIQACFSAGFCGDTETRAAIGGLYRAEGYLMDPHTAVAYRVLEDYRRESGDKKPAIVVSTASPFKFAADVAAALGKIPAEGEDPMELLSRHTGLPVPGPLAGLSSRPVRFGGSVEKENMRDSVEAFLA